MVAPRQESGSPEVHDYEQYEPLIRSDTVPAYYQILDIIKKRLIDDSGISVIYIGTSHLSRIEQEQGRQVYSNILRHLQKQLLSLRRNKIRRGDLITVKHAEGEELLIFLETTREQQRYIYKDLEALCDRIAIAINEGIQPYITPYLQSRWKISVGATSAIYNPLVQEDRFIHRVIAEARSRVSQHYTKILIKDKDMLEEIISKESVTTLFQPIVQLSNESVLGYEALSRGKDHSGLKPPQLLFDIAGETDLLFRLDQVCRKIALISAKGLDSTKLLFINCLPSIIYDPLFDEATLRQLLDRYQLSPRQIVLEISERERIPDYVAFRNAMKKMQRLGLSLAIDDVGSGYSSLEAVAELKPRFLKIDRSIVSGLGRTFTKQPVVKAILSLGKEIRATIIAEGVETEPERQILCGLGVTCGQGYLFAKPGPPYPKVSQSIH